MVQWAGPGWWRWWVLFVGMNANTPPDETHVLDIRPTAFSASLPEVIMVQVYTVKGDQAALSLNVRTGSAEGLVDIDYCYGPLERVGQKGTLVGVSLGRSGPLLAIARVLEHLQPHVCLLKYAHVPLLDQSANPAVNDPHYYKR